MNSATKPSVNRRLIFGTLLLAFLACIALFRTRIDDVDLLSPKRTYSSAQVDIPTFPNAGKLTAGRIKTFLNDIHIIPRNARLNNTDLASVNIVLMQLQAIGDSEGYTATLPTSSDLYSSLDATFEQEPAWEILKSRAMRNGEIEIFAVTTLINTIQSR